MKRFFFALALPLALVGASGGCSSIPSSPSAVASTTVLDEKGAIGVELAYTAAAKASSVAIRSGAVTDPAVIAHIGQLNEKAYAAVKAVRAAYAAGNSDSYITAFSDARTSIADVTAAF
jgi:hypothetical protein